jgi:hypothetical protein
MMDREALHYWIPAFAGMTAFCAATQCAIASLTSPRSLRGEVKTQIGFPAYGIDAVSPPSTGIAWPLT